MLRTRMLYMIMAIYMIIIFVCLIFLTPYIHLFKFQISRYLIYSWLQLATVLILPPGLVSASITREKKAGTLEHAALADINGIQILIGKILPVTIFVSLVTLAGMVAFLLLSSFDSIKWLRLISLHAMIISITFAITSLSIYTPKPSVKHEREYFFSYCNMLYMTILILKYGFIFSILCIYQKFTCRPFISTLYPVLYAGSKNIKIAGISLPIAALVSLFWILLGILAITRKSNAIPFVKVKSRILQNIALLCFSSYIFILLSGDEANIAITSFVKSGIGFTIIPSLIALFVLLTMDFKLNYDSSVYFEVHRSSFFSSYAWGFIFTILLAFITYTFASISHLLAMMHSKYGTNPLDFHYYLYGMFYMISFVMALESLRVISLYLFDKKGASPTLPIVFYSACFILMSISPDGYTKPGKILSFEYSPGLFPSADLFVNTGAMCLLLSIIMFGFIAYIKNKYENFQESDNAAALQ